MQKEKIKIEWNERKTEKNQWKKKGIYNKKKEKKQLELKEENIR